MSARRCPHCDQVLPEIRLGVALPPIKCRIFDIVSRAGRDGIDSEALFSVVYNNNMPSGKGIRETRSRKTLHNHIGQLNGRLEDADAGYRIVHSSGAYRLLKRAGQ
jgi:hypothetical protein